MSSEGPPLRCATPSRAGGMRLSDGFMNLLDLIGIAALRHAEGTASV